ncbi:enolase 4-like isoform X1 [Micropterus dolomieu]|uniref:enolase 4-like isoform X1 n=1 Tax=Micropterus dolomieu TaxID=147949 RepID=UPI001E8D5031|nr:enolase 4-like isoform X1 [Micropterus dolomieu]
MAYEGFTGRLSKEKQDLHDIKNSAAEFFRVNRIPQEIERALNELYFHKPEDVHGYLARDPVLVGGCGSGKASASKSSSVTSLRWVHGLSVLQLPDT